jgi:predicted nucleotide-binding protein (sugar kinase/HSP70/actin superfamily)
MSSLVIVPLQNNLALEVKKVEIKNKIIERINDLKINTATYRLNNELLLLVCNLVEHLVKKKYKINKKDFVVEIMNQLFVNLTPAEIQTINSNIEFLWSNKNITKLSRFYLFCCGAYEYFLKKK